MPERRSKARDAIGNAPAGDMRENPEQDLSVPLPSHYGLQGQRCETTEWRKPSSPLPGSSVGIAYAWNLANSEPSAFWLGVGEGLSGAFLPLISPASIPTPAQKVQRDKEVFSRSVS